MAKASPTQAWLWHHRLSHLNFYTINQLSKKDIINGLPKLKYVKDRLCSSCEMCKAKRSTFKTKTAEAIATACYTQNRSLIIPRHKKTPYHIINDRKPSLKHLYIFGCTCYTTKDGENHDKMKEKGDPYILVEYSTQLKGYRVYNKRTRLIVESIHINFDEIKELKMTPDDNTLVLAPQLQMTFDDSTSSLAPQQQMALDYDNFGLAPQLQILSSDTSNMKTGIQDHINEHSSSKLVPNVFSPADTDAP
ncbi:retrovirus-related pol polyprotein from transposon TNT 1-94 [Tanacetum coccineum]